MRCPAALPSKSTRSSRCAERTKAMDGVDGVTVRIVPRLADIPAAQWDACAGAANPFLAHAFLEALEASGSATSETGWLPQHLALEDDDGKLMGAVPLYLKSHSYGESVFYWGWASGH